MDPNYLYIQKLLNIILKKLGLAINDKTISNF